MEQVAEDNQVVIFNELERLSQQVAKNLDKVIKPYQMQRSMLP